MRADWPHRCWFCGVAINNSKTDHKQTSSASSLAFGALYLVLIDLFIVSLAVLFVLFFLGVSGCGAITLRPVQRDHALRMAQVRQVLATDDVHLNAALTDTQAQCDALDTEVTVLTSLTTGAGILAGASGVSAIFTSSTPRLAVSITGAILAVIGGAMPPFTASASQRFTRRCTVNTGGN